MTDYIIEYYTHKMRTPYKSIPCWLPRGERPKFLSIVDVIAYNDPKAKGFATAVRNAPIKDGRAIIRYARQRDLVGSIWMDAQKNIRIKWATTQKLSPMEEINKAFSESKKTLKL